MIAARPLSNAAGVPTQNAAGVPTPEEIEREVLDNVRHQALGSGTVEDLAMPEDFLRRVADRVIRTSYEERYRIVVQDEPKTSFRALPSFLVLAGSALAVVIAVVVVLVRARGRR